MELLIATFNIRLNHTGDKENAWPYRTDSALKFLNYYHPVIFGTQEVLDSQLEDLVNGLPDYHYVGINRRQKEEGNYIFYDKNILECKEYSTFWLSETPNIPNSVSYDSACVRICTFGEFLFKENRNVRFRLFNTHLDHVSSLAQLEGIKLIIEKAKQMSEREFLPTIIMGDFNVKDDNEVLTLLGNEGLINVYKYIDSNNYGASFHAFKGITEGSPIDYIFVTDNIKVKNVLICRDKVDNRFISDHYPVLAKIEL